MGTGGTGRGTAGVGEGGGRVVREVGRSIWWGGGEYSER